MARTVDAIDLPIPLEGAFEYRITEFEPPSRQVLVGGKGSLRSIDEITFVSRPGGTRISYEARLELSGLGRLADPFLDVLFQRIGSVAVRGLRERMAGRVSQADRVPRAGTRVRESHRSGSKRSRILRKVGKPHTQEGAS